MANTCIGALAFKKAVRDNKYIDERGRTARSVVQVVQ